jgi:hypothetical protein
MHAQNLRRFDGANILHNKDSVTTDFLYVKREIVSGKIENNFDIFSLYREIFLDLISSYMYNYSCNEGALKQRKK